MEGGHKKYVVWLGEEYHDINSLLLKIELIKNNYNDYIDKINYEYLSNERCCEKYCEIIKTILN